MLGINVGPYARIPIQRQIAGSRFVPTSLRFEIVGYATVSRHRAKRLLKYRWFAKQSDHSASVYAVHYIRVNGKTIAEYLHRIIAEELGIDTTQCVAHFPDPDTLNCSDENLKAASDYLNQCDRRKLKPGQSIYKGVTRGWRPGFWKAQIRDQKKLIGLGQFPSEVEAARAYDRAAIQLRPGWARLNNV